MGDLCCLYVCLSLLSLACLFVYLSAISGHFESTLGNDSMRGGDEIISLVSCTRCYSCLSLCLCGFWSLCMCLCLCLCLVSLCMSRVRVGVRVRKGNKGKSQWVTVTPYPYTSLALAVPIYTDREQASEMSYRSFKMPARLRPPGPAREWLPGPRARAQTAD